MHRNMGCCEAPKRWQYVGPREFPDASDALGERKFDCDFEPRPWAAVAQSQAAAIPADWRTNSLHEHRLSHRVHPTDVARAERRDNPVVGVAKRLCWVLVFGIASLGGA